MSAEFERNAGRSYRANRIGHASLYAIGNLLRNAASVALLPVYTHYLSPHAYGTLELVGLIVTWTAGLFGMQLGESMFRFYATIHDQAQRQAMTMATLVVAILTNLLAILLLLGVARPLAVLFLQDSAAAKLIAVLSLSLVAEALAFVPLTQMRAEGRVTLFFLLGVFRLVLQIVLNVAALAWLKMGVAGVIYSNVLACTIVAAVSLPYSLRGSALKVSWPAVRSLITFSAPLGVANVTNSYALSADRFFLGRMASLSDVGLYALGARLSQAFLVLVYQPFQQVWDAEKYRLVHAGPEGTRLPAVFSLMNYVLIAAALALALVAPDALALLSAPQFRGAATIVPLFLVAQILTANSDFVRVSTMAAGRTKMVLFTALVAAVVITPALLILIPLFGGRGAATAVILGSLVRLFIDHRVARRSNPVGLPWTRTALLAAVACGCWALGALGTASMSVFAALLVKAGLVALFLVVGWVVPLLTREARQLAMTLLAHALDLLRRRATPDA